MNAVNILGVKVDCIDRNQLLDLALSWARSQELRTVMYVNAHCLNLAFSDPAYRTALNAADLVYADGIGPVWAGRILGVDGLHKATASEWIGDFCRLVASHHLRVYILAGRPGVAWRARQNLVAEHPNLKVVGVADGFFEDKSEADTLEEIAQSGADILFVGRGSPLQEQWIVSQRTAIPVPVCWAVGSLFDLVAGEEPWPPPIAASLGLQWFWRYLMDPLGKFRRYILGNPLFLSRVARQRLMSGRAESLDSATSRLPGPSQQRPAVKRETDGF